MSKPLRNLGFKLPAELEKFYNFDFLVHWVAVILVHEHDLPAAAQAIGEDPSTMRQFQTLCCGQIGRFCKDQRYEIAAEVERIRVEAEKSRPQLRARGSI